MKIKRPRISFWEMRGRVVFVVGLRLPRDVCCPRRDIGNVLVHEPKGVSYWLTLSDSLLGVSYRSPLGLLAWLTRSVLPNGAGDQMKKFKIMLGGSRFIEVLPRFVEAKNRSLPRRMPVIPAPKGRVCSYRETRPQTALVALHLGSSRKPLRLSERADEYLVNLS